MPVPDGRHQVTAAPGRIAVWHKISLAEFDTIYNSLELEGTSISGPPVTFTGQLLVNTGTAGALGTPGTAAFYEPPPRGMTLLIR